MAFTERQLDSILNSTPDVDRTNLVELVRSYRNQREKLAELHLRIEVLEETILDANHRNTELDLQRRLAQSKLQKLQNDYNELDGRMKGLEK